MSENWSFRRFVPSRSILISIGIIGFLFYAFFSGLSVRFYASFFFWFYSVTNSAWISVILLGIFQTILMMPLRAINLRQAVHIQEFEEELEKVESEKEQYLIFKKNVLSGYKPLLFYTVNFFIQITTFLSIGRLFLTDFYSKALDPNMLFDFAPYPTYPIQDINFQLPYFRPAEVLDLGLGFFLFVLILIITYKVLINRLLEYYNQIPTAKQQNETRINRFIVRFLEVTANNSIVLIVIAWFLTRFFPVSWEFAIFSGAISTPNITLNTITAIATFFTVIWLNHSRNRKKIELAESAGIPKEIIEQTRQKMLKEDFRNATLIGLGAFFITNQIPSAFELSIFTFELISWLSPFTLDRFIQPRNQ